MLFNSVAFLIFLPLVFLFYWKVFPRNLRLQNFFVLVASYFFYGWWDWRFLLLISTSSLIDYISGIRIDESQEPSRKKFWLGVSLAVNIGLLSFFKYFDFFVDSFISSFSTFGIQLNRPTLEIILPVGISFYTFQTLSYTIDIYRQKLKPTKNALAFFAFVAFFPQLVAGPIERASHLLPQFLKPRKFNAEFATSGLRIMLWGFFKKIAVADNLAPLVDQVYSSPSEYQGLPVILAGVFFTIQVYCDFSGYSDIAIGCGRLFGFDLMTNFRTPFFSRNIAEFWNRWHISLSTWFRDYIYIPLGGNKVSAVKWTINILIVFGISGLWHGAKWTFVIWGILNALYLIIGRFTEKQRLAISSGLGFHEDSMIKQVWDWFVVTSLFGFALIIFRAEDFGVVRELGAHLFSGLKMQLVQPGILQLIIGFFGSVQKIWIVSLSIFILFAIDLSIFKEDFSMYFSRKPRLLRWPVYYLLFSWTFLFGAFTRPEAFVYFQF